MTYEEHEAHKQSIRDDLYARVKTSLWPRSEEADGPIKYYLVRARTRIPYNVTPSFVMGRRLTLEEYAEAMSDLSLLDKYRAQCVTALHEAVDTYCANLIDANPS